MTAPEDRRPLLYLEDFAVGQRFTTALYVLDADAITAFAAQFDPQPFHLSDTAASSSLFGGLAASGWHTAALTMRLLVESGPRLAGGVVGAEAAVRWPKPTRPGDVLHVESEVVSITPSRSRPERGMMVLRSDTYNQRGEIVQSLTAKLVVQRRPTGAASKSD